MKAPHERREAPNGGNPVNVESQVERNSSSSHFNATHLALKCCGPNGQVPNETRPAAAVRRAGLAQLEQVQHAAVTWLVQWQPHTQNWL